MMSLMEKKNNRPSDSGKSGTVDRVGINPFS